VFVRRLSSHYLHLLTLLGLVLLTAWIYAPALDFGFFWDDPLWYSRVVDKSLGELLSPSPSYHFYRPTLLLYNRLFVRPDGTFATISLHLAQIGWHLLNLSIVYALIRRLEWGHGLALATALLMALHPFSYQAVAWEAPAQPWAAFLHNGSWLAFVLARQNPGRRLLFAVSSLVLFVLALTVLEGTAALAGLPLLLEWILRKGNVGRPGWRLSLLYPALAFCFGLLWLWVPRQGGFTQLTLDFQVVLYLLQGIIFPWLGRPHGYAPGQLPSSGLLLGLTLFTLAGLVALAHRGGRIRPALLGLAWALMGIALPILGLGYSYVKSSPRLLYISSPGVALLWAAALLPRWDGSALQRWWRVAGVFLLGLISLQSGSLLAGFRQMYADGTQHLDELIRATAAGEEKLMFVNFPDRYAPKRPPYPRGYWGMVLAPVSVDLGAFSDTAIGRHPHTISRSMPWIDEDSRAVGPYQVDMRGVIAPPGQLYAQAQASDRVYLSRYSPAGTFLLRPAGAFIGAGAPIDDPDQVCRLARFGDILCLQAAQIQMAEDDFILTLTWLSLAEAQPHDTVFVHMSKGSEEAALVAQADGDTWLGMLPLSVWRPGDLFQDQRTLTMPPTSLAAGGTGVAGQVCTGCTYVVRVGIYNRLTGQRLPARSRQPELLTDDAFQVVVPPQG
jgi:hypothetical protein